MLIQKIICLHLEKLKAAVVYWFTASFCSYLGSFAFFSLIDQYIEHACYLHNLLYMAVHVCSVVTGRLIVVFGEASANIYFSIVELSG